MKRQRPIKVSRELQAAIELHNKANRIAKVDSRKPRYVLRAEANAVRRELKHDSMMTAAQRSRAEQFRQVRLTIQRARAEAVKRVGRIMEGLGGQEKKTEMGLIVPAGAEIGKILTKVRE